MKTKIFSSMGGMRIKEQNKMIHCCEDSRRTSANIYFYVKIRNQAEGVAWC